MAVTHVSVEKASIKKVWLKALSNEEASSTKFMDAATAISSIEINTFSRWRLVKRP
jgi:hypothetical protein